MKSIPETFLKRVFYLLSLVKQNAKENKINIDRIFEGYILSIYLNINRPCQAKMSPRTREKKMCGFMSSCTCAMSHPGIRCSLKHSMYPMNLFADSEGPD